MDDSSFMCFGMMFFSGGMLVSRLCFHDRSYRRVCPWFAASVAAAASGLLLPDIGKFLTFWVALALQGVGIHRSPVMPGYLILPGWRYGLSENQEVTLAYAIARARGPDLISADGIAEVKQLEAEGLG